MLGEEFFKVDPGFSMGPISIGMTREQVVKELRTEGLDEDLDEEDSDPELYVPEIETTFVFSKSGDNLLRRIDVEDVRVRFATWEVIPKPIHKVVRFFKCEAADTLWCDLFDEGDEEEYRSDEPIVRPDYELLSHGTLWIPAQGLGFTVDDCLVETVHICDPDVVPKFGTGTWTLAHQRFSEAGIMPQRPKVIRSGSSLTYVLHVCFAMAMGWVVWTGTLLQSNWSQAPDVTAKVIAVDPPPPEPFGNNFTVQYSDTNGKQYQAVLPRMNFYVAPKLDEEVVIRFLPNEPDKPLGPNHFKDVGFDSGVPYAIVIGMLYSALLVIVSLVGGWRSWKARR